MRETVLTASPNARQVARRERSSGNLPEVLIWRELRKRPGGYKFRRQHPLSEVVLDFACLEARLAIEVDGEAHDRGDRPQRDGRRDAYLKSRGFTVLRLPAAYVLENLEGAVATIVNACDEQRPHRIGSADRPLRAGEVLKDSAEPTSLRYGETGLQGKPERPL
jgi:very-short-patch-repair endonuclease